MADSVHESQELLALAVQWLQYDRDTETRSVIANLVDTKDYPELQKCLKPRIAFGTAGLRAEMGAGWARMNRLTVIQACQGLLSYACNENEDALSKGIVIGHDHRWNSDTFAEAAAAVFINGGMRVKWLGQVHTPLVAFGVKSFEAAAGIMITASHNAAQYNGLKVYWSNGSQIVSPRDEQIAQAIERNLTPKTWTLDHQQSMQNFKADVQSKYIAAVGRLVDKTSLQQMPLVVATGLHGVGIPALNAVISELGAPLENFIVVTEQAQPDPRFPTVKFPNPEEKGTLNLAYDLADRRGASFVIALDPDADRFSAAERLSDGNWHQFTGNEMGILLASSIMDSLLPFVDREHKHKAVLMNTAVSTRMLKEMATNNHMRYVETLTGFKWLGNKSHELEKNGFEVPLAFEEALGYMFPRVVSDKDGVCTAVVFLSLLEIWQRHSSRTPWTVLQDLYREYGYFVDANTYLISPSPTVTTMVFESIRNMGSDNGKVESRPTSLGHRSITRWRDLTVGFDDGTDSQVPDLPVDPKSEMITFELTGQTHVTLRGSGTEPKIKMYIESQAETKHLANVEAEAVQRDLIELWFKPEHWSLSFPS